MTASCVPVSDRGGVGPVGYMDLTGLLDLDLSNGEQARQAWDTLHLVATVQGIVNRAGPNLFIRLMPGPDDFWWDYLRREVGWPSGRTVEAIETIESLLGRYADLLKGVVVYRERPWVGSNVASTIAGVEDRVAIRWDEAEDSVCQRVLRTGLPFVSDELRLFDADGVPVWDRDPITHAEAGGSGKRAAYLWLKRYYLNTGCVSDRYLAYYLDAFWLTDPAKETLPNCTLTNHDFFVSQRAMFVDLHVWEEESPVDEPEQPAGTDLRTLRELLRAMHDRSAGGLIHIGGFTPWAWKYSDHPGAGSKHGGVDTEWKMVKEVSSYNGYLDADALSHAGMTNASFYQHFPLLDHYPQNERPKASELKQAGLLHEDGGVKPGCYVLLYLGDYDSAAWLNQMVPMLWQDSMRGKVTCNWAFNPCLDRRAPHAMHYVRTHQSARDWFISGDSGSGYLNPSMLTAPRSEPDLPDGWSAWVAHNESDYARYGLSITGFIIEGHSPGMSPEGFDAYMRFSPDGLVCHRHCPPTGLHRGVMPYVRHTSDLPDDPDDAARRLLGSVDASGTQFLFFRCVLKSPSWVSRLMDQVHRHPAGGRVHFVDPYTFFGLLARHEERRRDRHAREGKLDASVERITEA